MKLSKFICIAMLLLSVSTAFSQQLPQFTQYMFNTISINPAYAGSRETLSIVGLHRSQWVGFDGAPTTQAFAVNSPLKNKNMGMGYMLLAGLIMLASWLVSSRLKNKFEHYSKLQLQNGMSGAEIAQQMLADNGIRDVRVISVPGRLTDHYNPTDKTVNLSEAVYSQRNAAAAAGKKENEKVSLISRKTNNNRL